MVVILWMDGCAVIASSVVRFMLQISMFSIHVLTQTPVINMCGLFVLDYARLYGVLTNHGNSFVL